MNKIFFFGWAPPPYTLKGLISMPFGQVEGCFWSEIKVLILMPFALVEWCF